ncbi:MAG: pre-peptidase C-terminal domain-containing protein [Bacteroidales bacterium]|nr:pre-peptidase C-terminal domain-containing protein [Bacteroidales bacterium]
MKLIKNIPLIILVIPFLLNLSGCKKDEDPFKDGLEPNNSRSEAFELTLGEQIDASIAKGDHDWFSFSVETNGIIYIAGIAIENLADEMELTVVLYDSQGNQFGSFTGNAGINMNINLSTRTGSYYIEIYDKNSDHEGKYKLTITLLQANDPNEPDDTFADARIVSSYPSGVITGTILINASDDNQNGDFEFFVLLVNSNKKVSFTLTPDADDIKMNYTIFKEDHSVVVAETEGTVGQILQASVGSGSGGSLTRYLRVGATLGDTGNGDYTISFTETDI